MRLSVIIPTYNSVDRLKLSLYCIANQTIINNDCEVIVVNDGSTDGTKEFLDNLSYSFDLKIIHQKNMGQSAARKNGCAVATGDIFLFIDDDILFNKFFFERHISLHDKDNKIVVGKINNIPFNAVPTVLNTAFKEECLDFSAISALVVRDEYLGIRDVVWQRNLEYIRWLSFTAANASIKKSTLLKSGGFDDLFSGWGPEDVELGYRLNENCCEFVYDSTVECFHLDKQKNKETFYHNLASNLRYLREEKYPNNHEIQGYILFIGGYISIEDFNCRCSKGQKKYVKSADEYYFKFSYYFLNKV